MPERRRRDGFTLFEILGAVMILALVYTWLATSAMQGMRWEGLSKRRMEASLLVDEQLMEIETALATGATPEIGRREEPLGEFSQLIVEVTPFDPTPFLGEEFPPEGATSTLLLPPERPEDSFLRVVRVLVQWHEGDEEEVFQVERITLAYDQEQITALFPEEGAGEDEEDPTPSNEDALEQLKELLRSLDS